MEFADLCGICGQYQNSSKSAKSVLPDKFGICGARFFEIAISTDSLLEIARRLFISKFGSPLGGVQIWNRVSPQWNLRISADYTASVPNLYCAPKFGAGPTPATGCSRGVGGASDKKLFLETGLQRPKLVLNFDEMLTSPGDRLTKP